MTNKKIQNFINEKSSLITKVLLHNYDSADFDIHFSQIEKEIFQIALSYADIFFFENNYLDEKMRKEFISRIISRFNVKEKIVLKMNDNNLLAHYIKAEVVEKLRDNNFLLV
jgi:hypothetical protein